MKKLINRADDFVRESLEGLALAHPDLIKVELDPKLVYRADAPLKGKVAIISGGGSGHEPMHGGFVGRGMLTAACPGEVFTSPTPDQMHAAAQKVNSGAGVLNIVKNYTGDVMNFEMAAELAHADGIPVANILVDDDVAVKDSLYTAGRRGVGTTVIMEKIVGSAAEKGYDLDRLEELARRVNLSGRSMGMALDPCTPPAKGSPSFELGSEEMEIGIGIHGEPGRERANVRSADEITQWLAHAIFKDSGYKRTIREFDRSSGEWREDERIDLDFKEGDQFIVMVNGMGGTPVSELYVVYRQFEHLCRKKGFGIARKLVGSYITSLEMPGCSLTMVKADDEMLELWDEPVLTPALRWGC